MLRKPCSEWWCWDSFGTTKTDNDSEPANIKDYKRLLNEGVANVGPHEQFNGSDDDVAPSILLNFAAENIPLTADNSGKEPLILNEKPTLGAKELVPNLPIGNAVSETKRFEV